MPRQVRIAVPAQVYHVVSRGNNLDRIFWDDDDYAGYLDLCRRYKERDGFKLYHWVLMPFTSICYWNPAKDARSPGPCRGCNWPIPCGFTKLSNAGQSGAGQNLLLSI